MARTALYDELAAWDARMGEYCGAETAGVFVDAPTEYVVLRAGCGLYDLGWRARIAVTGQDRTRWLNGMISNNMRDLPVNRGAYNFVLNHQGHILGDLYAYNRGEYFLLATDAWQAPTLVPLLRKYIIMDQVELTDISDKLTAVAVQGPKSAEVLAAAGLDPAGIEPLQVQDSVWRGMGISLTRMTSDEFPSYEIWAATEDIRAVWDAVLEAGAMPVGTDALEMFRVAAGIPRYGQDIRERDLPQETGQMQALSFTKGCYVGQEIVERIRSRGGVHRTFTGFVVESGAPSAGTKLQRDGKDVGELTTVRAVPTANGDRMLALGYIRREAAAPGTVLNAGEAQVKVQDVPFKEN
jgi:aminomethyltransferase